MEWEVTFLVVEAAALCCIAYLWRRPPDLIQFGFLALVFVSMLVYVGADVAALSGIERTWPIRLIASRVEHVAVLLYLFRQAWIKTEVCQSLKYPSPT